jgi:hypothetical protein
MVNTGGAADRLNNADGSIELDGLIDALKEGENV